MTNQLELIKAIRSGRLKAVKAVLDAGVPAETATGHEDDGLPMGIACFMGFVDIVRELAARGARVDLPDNGLPTSPLSMALRGHRVEVVRALIELGAKLPPGVNSGLSEQELLVAQWKAARRAGSPEAHEDLLQKVEEINLIGCSGTDTQVLESDALKAALARR